VPDRSLLLTVVGGLAGIALLVALVTSYAARRSIAELRIAQLELAREIRTVKDALKAAASIHSEAPINESDIRREGEEGVRVALSGSVKIEALRRRISELETNKQLQVIRDNTIDRVSRLHGKARAEALEDLEVLLSLGDEEARQVVRSSLSDPDPRVRESAVGLISKSGDSALLDELEPLVRDPNADVRKELAGALEDAPIDTAGPLLMMLLDDEDSDVVEDAVKSLGALRYEEAKDRISALIDPWNPKLTGAVGEALSDFGDLEGVEAAIEALASVLQHDDPSIRQRAVKEIGQIGGPSARAYLEAALDDEDYGVSSEARKRLSKL